MTGLDTTASLGTQATLLVLLLEVGLELLGFAFANVDSLDLGGGLLDVDRARADEFACVGQEGWT